MKEKCKQNVQIIMNVMIQLLLFYFEEESNDYFVKENKDELEKEQVRLSSIQRTKLTKRGKLRSTQEN